MMKDYTKNPTDAKATKIKNHIKKFNAATNNYADFTFDSKKGKLVYPKGQKVMYDLSRYADKGTATKELVNSIRLGQTKEFQEAYAKNPLTQSLSKKSVQSFVKSTEGLKLSTQARNFIEAIGCPGFAAGGRAGFEDGKNCFLKGKEKIRTGQIKPGAEEFNFKKLAKLAGNARGIARATGLGLAWEAAFAPIIVGWMGSEGESWERMKHELAYGPIWEALGVPPEYVPGKSAKEEQIEYFGKPGYNVARIDEIGNEFANLKAQEAIEIYKSSKIGGDRPYETQSLKQIRDQMKKLKDEYMQVSGTFYEGPAGQHVGYEKLEQALQDKDWGEFDLQMDKEARKEELRKKGFLAEKDWMKNANLGYDNYLPDIDDDK